MTGEIIASVRAIMRTLESEKLDIHALAEAVENGHAANGGGFSEREKQKILERSIEIGKRLAQGRREDGGPSWHEIACACAARPERHRDERETEFVADMVRRTVHSGEPTEKQANWLRAIYARVRR